MRILRLYTFFAILATIANIGAQIIVLNLWKGHDLILHQLPLGGLNLPREALLASICAGTLIGLVVKYYLDKTYIFKSADAHDTSRDMAQFALYCATAVFTTLVFWGVEIGFDHIFQSAFMRYVGAVLGLAIGYALKFVLDWKYVFQDGFR